MCNLAPPPSARDAASATTSTNSDTHTDTATLDDLDQALLRIHSYAEIRLFIAGTANFGHQAASVDVLLRLVGDYGYGGLITVVYDEGNPGCGVNVEKLPRLLGRYMDRDGEGDGEGEGDGLEMLPRRMHAARVQWFSLQEVANAHLSDSDSDSGSDSGSGLDSHSGSPSRPHSPIRQLIDFGLTGGAEIGRVYRCSLADMLNVRVALKAQPFQWPWCRDGIDFHSSSQLPSIDLLGSDYLGSRLFHTAYRLPRSMTMQQQQQQQSWPSAKDRDGQGQSQSQENKGNDSFLRRLLAVRAGTSDDPWTSLSCVYGLRETNGVSHIDPANLLYIYLVALLEGAAVTSSECKGGKAPAVLVVNFDKFWADAFARLQDYVHGRHDASAPYSMSRNPPGGALPTSGDLSARVRCIHGLEQLSAALDWLQEPSPQPQAVAAAHSQTNNGVKILYAHVGFVSPEAFIQALRQANLPIIFEGQHTASAVASLGKPYLKLQDSVLQCPTQLIRLPDDMHQHGDVLARIQHASLSLQNGALGTMPFEQSVQSVARLIAECADSDSKSQMNVYLAHLRWFYQQRGQDKFEQLLRAWNRFACVRRPERMSEADARAAARRRCMPRMVEEVVLDVENVRKMLGEFGL
ncbi:hypothetical protein E4U55_005173 [Claviceps digitariae]|nr:hypothetical protein E4U55_005173 [Claviceps digitariae]